MKVTGETMLFKNDFGFSTTISNKKQDGTYDNMSIVVQFKKDDRDAQNIPTKTKINILNGFLTFYYSTSGEKKLKLAVLEYEVVGAKKETGGYQDPFAKSEDCIGMNTVVSYDGLGDDDDLPF